VRCFPLAAGRRKTHQIGVDAKCIFSKLVRTDAPSVLRIFAADDEKTVTPSLVPPIHREGPIPFPQSGEEGFHLTSGVQLYLDKRRS
jgi:hypothetical protein